VEKEITIHGIPVIGSGATIQGANEVCVNTNDEDFSIIDPGNGSGVTYKWSFDPIGTSFTSTGVHAVEVDFAGNDVTMTVQIQETHGGLVCSGDAIQKTVTVDAIPTVSFEHNPITVACGSTGNKSTIQPYDADLIYSIGTETTDTTFVENVSIGTGSDVGKVLFDVTSTTGSINVIVASNTGAKCESSGLMEYSAAGCVEPPIANKTRACPDETVTFSSRASAGSGGETIEGYLWSFSGDGVGQVDNTKSTYEVKVANSTTSAVTLTATVVTSFMKHGQTITISEDVSVFVNPLPDLTAGEITGESVVCKDSEGFYTYSDDNYASYNWTVVNADKTSAGNSREIQGVSFANSDIANQVQISVELGKKVGELTCNATDEIFLVTVDPIPTIAFEHNPITVACGSAGNEATFSPYDAANFTYSIGTADDDTTFVANVSLVENRVLFDVTDTRGSINIIVDSKNGATCSGNELLEYSTAGCVNPPSVLEGRVCPETEVTFFSNAVATDNDEIISFAWSFSGEGVEEVDNTKTTYKVLVGNSTTSAFTMTATVVIVFEKNGQQISISEDVSVIVNPLPNLSAGAITGKNPVCEGSTELYTYSDATYFSYNWAVSNGDKASGGNDAEIQGVSFVDSDLTLPVKISVELSQDFGRFGVICKATDDTMLVTIETTPIVEVAQTAIIQCGSTGNTVEITNYNPASAYIITTTGGLIWDGNQPDANGLVTYAAGTATLLGSITIQEKSAIDCKSNAVTVEVKITGCGRGIDYFTSSTVVCSGDTVTFTPVVELGASGDIIAYLWEFNSGVAIDPLTNEIVRVVVENLTELPITVEGKLKVTFTDDPRELNTSKLVVTVNSRPQLSLGSIEGPLDVCINSTDVYYLEHPNKADFNYFWTESDGTGEAGTLINERRVTFENITDLSVPVEIKLSVTDDVTNCASSDTLKILVNVDAIPTVTFLNDPVTVPCYSTLNEVTIANYDATNFTYSIGTTANDTLNATNVSLVGDKVIFDVKDNVGSINIVVVSKTGGLCAGNGSFTFIPTGCNSEVSVVAERVCPETTVEFTSDAIAGEGERIVGYSWSFSGNGTVVGEADESTYNVTVINPTTAVVTLTATVEVAFEKNGQIIVITTSHEVTVNGLPDVAVSAIEGDILVCENSEGTYRYSDNTLDSYAWTVVNATKVNQSTTEEQLVSFVGSSIDEQVIISVEVGKDVGGVVCTTTDEVFVVDIEALPIVEIVPLIGIQCESLGQSVRINNPDPTATYSIVTGGGLIWDGNQPNLDGDIFFDTGTATSSGSISISVQRNTGAQCVSASDTVVIVKVLGCDIRIDASHTTSCPSVTAGSDSLITFSADLTDVANVKSYIWDITPIDFYEVVGASDEEVITLKIINTLEIDVSITAELSVEYINLDTVKGPDQKTVVIYPAPDAGSFELGIADSDVNNSHCADEQHDFVLLNFNSDTTKVRYSFSFISMNNDEQRLSSSVIDSLLIINGRGSYTVTAEIRDVRTQCRKGVSKLVEVATVPGFGSVFGDSVMCEITSTQRDASTYFVSMSDQFDITWSVESFNGSIVNQDWIEYNYLDEDGLILDTIVDVSVIGSVYMNSYYKLIATGVFTKVFDDGECVSEQTADSTFFVDETFNVDFSIIADTLYCEGDTGYFYVDLSNAVNDFDKTFGTRYNHYFVTTWTYNEEDFKADNLWDTQDNLVTTDGTYFSEYTSRTDAEDTVREAEYLQPLDSVWSTYRGPFGLEDEIIFTVDPQFCWNRTSDLDDTLLINPMEKPLIDLTVNGDSVHVLTEVLAAPSVDVLDEANVNNDFDIKYVLTWFDTDGNLLGKKTPNWLLEEDDLQMPGGYDTIVFGVLLNKKVCNVYDTAYLVMNYELFPPTAFTPNGDDVHDTWHIENIDKFPSATVEVYNRWGSLLYSGGDYPNNEWDGTYEGKVLPVASYYYIIDLQNGSDKLSGAVSIFK